MKIIAIDKKDWKSGLEKARKRFRLVGPIRGKGQKHTEFQELSSNQLPDLSDTDTVLSPKSIVYPQSEPMFSYSTSKDDTNTNLLKRTAKAYPPTAVIGIRPYDAAAFLIAKKNFDTPEYRDPYWCDAYESCTFVGLAVNTPGMTDFSTSVGSGPFSEKGLDVLLIDTKDRFFAKVLTDKGDEFLAATGFIEEADETAVKVMDDLKQAAENQIQFRVSFDNVTDAAELDLYNAEFWEEISFSCINCGTCTYLCPTCWCFDIQDETRRQQGCRFKNWDSCMESRFTLHASGHNPRETKLMRVRQRFMHKLKYYLDKYGDGIMCVGCGRCVRSCPVNIDIREVLKRMNNYDPACAV